MYPTEPDQQKEFWQRQVEYSLGRVEPYFKASDVLVKLYDGVPASLREISQEAAKGGQDKHTRSLKANIVFSWIDQEISSNLIRNPRIKARGTTREGVLQAPGVSKWLNYSYRETKQLEQDERIALDSYLTPYGVKKIMFFTDDDLQVENFLNADPDFAFNSPEEELGFILEGRAPRILEEQNHERFIEFYEHVLQEPRANDDLPPALSGLTGLDIPNELPRSTEILIEDLIRAREHLRDRADPDTSAIVNRGMPAGLRWPSRDFVFDAWAEDAINDARWVAFRWRLPPDEVRDNPNWDKDVIDDMDIVERLDNAPNHSPLLAGLGEDDGFGINEGWEIWARNWPVRPGVRRNIVFTYEDNTDLPLQNDEEWPYRHIETFPVQIVSMQAGVHQWFNQPTLSLAGTESLQSLTNEILDGYLNIARKQKNIWMYDPDYIDEDLLTRILAAPDASAFPVERLKEIGANVIVNIPFHAVPEEKKELLGITQGIHDRVAGTSEPGRLDLPDSATGSSIIDKRVSARGDRRANKVRAMQLGTMIMYWQLSVQFRPDRAFMLDEEAEQWLSITDDMVRGQYLFEMDIDSQANSLVIERKQWTDILNLATGAYPLFKQEYGIGPNLPAIFAKLLMRGFEQEDSEIDEMLPMLEIVKQMQTIPPEEIRERALQLAAQNAVNQGGILGPNGQPVSPTEEVVDPASMDALVEGNGAPEVGPALPEQFSEDAPTESRQRGDAATP